MRKGNYYHLGSTLKRIFVNLERSLSVMTYWNIVRENFANV